MNIKDLLKKHGLTILCAVALIMLFLPFFSVTAEIEILGHSSSSSTTITGFSAMKDSLLGWLLILGPVLLIAMNYIKQLESRKGLLAIVVPAVCLLAQFITFFQAKAAAVSTSGGGMASAGIKTSLGIGFFLLILVYIGMIVVSAMLYHNFTLDKAGLERLKAEGSDLLGDSLNKIKEGSNSIISSAGEKISNMQANATSSAADGDARPQPKKKTNYNDTHEVLALIEKLAAMKESGILTEEEFTAKKKELLEDL